MDKKDCLKKITDIRHRCGEVQFRMALQHLFDTGHQNFNAADVAEAKTAIRKETSKTPILTAEFQCELLDCCLEISQLPVWDIFLYIKLYLSMEGDDRLFLEEAERSLRGWNDIPAPQSWRDACADPDTREEILREMVRGREGGYTTAEIVSAIRAVSENE